MFSVIIPVFNKLPYLNRSIGSVLDQTCTDFELILVDDGSTDGSKEHLSSYHDPRIRLFFRKEPMPGGYAARNLGIRMARYDWICFLDADDRWDRTFLSVYKHLILSNKDVRVFSSSWKLISSGGIKPCNLFGEIENEKVTKFSYLDYLSLTASKKPPICTSVAVCHKNAITRCGMFPENRCKIGGDVDTWLRLMRKENCLMHYNIILAGYYLNSVNRTTNYKDTGIGCIIPTCRRFIRESDSDEEKERLKEFSNRFLYYLMIRKMMSGEQCDFLLQYFYKKKNFMTYMFFKAGCIKPVNHLLSKAIRYRLRSD